MMINALKRTNKTRKLNRVGAKYSVTNIIFLFANVYRNMSSWSELPVITMFPNFGSE